MPSRVRTFLQGCGLGRATVLVSMLALLFVGRDHAEAQEHRYNETEIKAVFLFNFAQFVTWPGSAFAEERSPFVIGVLGDDPFGRVLDDVVAGETVNGRRLTVERYRRVEDVRGQILFVGKMSVPDYERIFAGLKGRPILTVGDTEGFARLGGVIRFLNERNRIRLRVNVEAAREAQLSISSSLLRAADIVTTERPR